MQDSTETSVSVLSCMDIPPCGMCWRETDRQTVILPPHLSLMNNDPVLAAHIFQLLSQRSQSLPVLWPFSPEVKQRVELRIHTPSPAAPSTSATASSNRRKGSEAAAREVAGGGDSSSPTLLRLVRIDSTRRAELAEEVCISVRSFLNLWGGWGAKALWTWVLGILLEKRTLEQTVRRLES